MQLPGILLRMEGRFFVKLAIEKSGARFLGGLINVKEDFVSIKRIFQIRQALSFSN